MQNLFLYGAETEGDGDRHFRQQGSRVQRSSVVFRVKRGGVHTFF